MAERNDQNAESGTVHVFTIYSTALNHVKKGECGSNYKYFH